MKKPTDILERIKEIIFERVQLRAHLDDLPIKECMERMEAIAILSARPAELLWVLGVTEDQLRIGLREN